MLRFASSPTGDMHIGDLRIAILNYLVAQQKNESFIVRIEDRDKEKMIEGKDTEIMQILEKFALPHASVFHQSEHLRMHQTLAIQLLKEKKAFICLCSEEAHTDAYSGRCIDASHDVDALKKEKIPFVIRMKQPTAPIAYDDMIQGERVATPQEVDDFVILGEDGIPSYNFACACDDMLSGVNFIICQENHLLDTPRQKHIKAQLGYEEETRYAHLPAILHTESESSVIWLFEQGFIPNAIINYLLILGNMETPQEIFTLPEAIEWFSLEALCPSSVTFDLERLRSINKEHLKRMDDKALSSLFGFADADVGKLVKLYLEEVSTINELALKIRPIFAPKVLEGEEKEKMQILQKLIENAPMIATFDAFKLSLIQQSGLEEQALLQPLRILLTGSEYGPELSLIYPLIKPYLLEVISS